MRSDRSDHLGGGRGFQGERPVADARQSGDPGGPDPRCRAGGHSDLGGVCGVCGEWLPVATCRSPDCHWRCADGEDTLVAAVGHQQGAGHRVRVVIN